MTKISFCELTWPVTAGCKKCEKGCAKCWAIRSAQRLKGKGIRGYDKVVDKNGWTGHIELMPWNLDKPLQDWKKPRRIFVNSMSDLFHKEVSNCFIDRVFDIVDGCKQHTYLIFTKRIKEAYEYFASYNYSHSGMRDRYLSFNKNIQLILSLSTQKEADEKIPILLKIPAAVRGLSLEPLLEGIDLRTIRIAVGTMDALTGEYHGEKTIWGNNLDWVIVGCESLSGLKAGRFQDGFIEAARNLVGQCQAASVPIYVKQIPINGKVSRNPKEWPKDLRIQQYPN